MLNAFITTQNGIKKIRIDIGENPVLALVIVFVVGPVIPIIHFKGPSNRMCRLLTVDFWWLSTSRWYGP